MYPINRQRVWIPLSMLCMAVLLNACTGQGIATVKQDTDEQLVWPLAPNKPRIEYLGSLTHPDDLGITKGFMDKLKDLALGEKDNGMVLPMAVVENSVKQLYVADPGVKAVHRFDRKNGRYDAIKRRGGGDFESPVSLAADSDGKVYITDSELGQVFVVAADEKEAVALQLEEDFIRPTGIAIDKSNGWIYIVDTGLHAISIFNPNLSLLKKFGHRGSGDGEFNFPTHIWLTRNRELLVTDSLNFRIQLLDRHGNYLNQFGIPGNAAGTLSRPKGVAQDSYDHTYVVDSLFHNVQLFDASGSVLMHFGQQGSQAGEFWLPVGIYISENDTIYICDSYNKRVQLFQYIGDEP